MSLLNLDFTNVKELTNLSVGKHVLRVRKVEQVQASTGNSMLTVTFENAQGEVGVDNFVLTESALWKLKNLLVALFRQNFTGKFNLDTDKMIGRTCVATAKEEEYVKQDGTPAIRTVLDNYMPVNEADTMGVTPQAPVQPQPTPVAPQPTAPAQPYVAPVAPQPAPAQPFAQPVQPQAVPGFAQAEANPFPQTPVQPMPQAQAPVQPAPVQPTAEVTPNPAQPQVAKRPWEL